MTCVIKEIPSEILVGGVAGHIDERLHLQGESLRLTAKKVGLILKTLGFKTKKLGRMGRGLQFTASLKREIHAAARQLGIDRRTTASLAGLDAGYGGAPCVLCDEFDLAGGLRLAEPPSNKFKPSGRLPKRPPLFEVRDNQ